MIKYIYGLKKDGKLMLKGDCQEVSKFLGIMPTTLASYRWCGKECNGYEITLEEQLKLPQELDPRYISKKRKEEKEKAELVPRIKMMCDKPPFYCTIIRIKELTDELKQELGENYTYVYLKAENDYTVPVWKVIWNGK